MSAYPLYDAVVRRITLDNNTQLKALFVVAKLTNNYVLFVRETRKAYPDLFV